MNILRLKKTITCFTVLGASGGVSLALAQGSVPLPAGALAVGDGLLVYPSVSAKLGYDDNVRATGTNTIGSTQYTLLPSLRAEAKRGGDVFTLGYNGEYTGYANSSGDNFNNHDVLATGAHILTSRNRLKWQLGYQDRVDPRTEITNTGAQPDQWTGQTASAVYSYGVDGAQGKFEVEYAFNSKRYQNNATTAQASDMDGNRLAGRFFWRVMPKTYLLTEASWGLNNYRFNNGTATDNDNTDQRLLVGATWEATAKTRGTVKLGQQKKRFDGTSRAGASGFTYDASVSWAPVSYSTFTLTAGRSADDSTSNGDYQKSKRMGVNWAHQWNSLWSTRANLSSATSDFVNSARKDDTLTTGLGMGYQMRRNLQIGLDYTNTQRDSTQAGTDFKRNTLLLSLNASL